MASRLTLSVLSITTRSRTGITRDPGLSFLLETDEKKICSIPGIRMHSLPMQGTSETDLLDLDYVILSHGHFDHTGGLVALIRHLAEAKINHIPHQVPHLVAHPLCFCPRPRPPLPNTGSPLGEEKVRRHFPVNLSCSQISITGDLVFLGEVPRRFASERTNPGTRTILLPDGSTAPDFLLDDSALAFQSGAGLIIITGCSHAGICNIAEYAREVCGKNRIVDIIGGFHLVGPSQKNGCRVPVTISVTLYLRRCMPAIVPPFLQRSRFPGHVLYRRPVSG